MHAGTHVCTPVCTHVCTHVNTHVETHAHTHVHAHAYTQVPAGGRRGLAEARDTCIPHESRSANTAAPHSTAPSETTIW